MDPKFRVSVPVDFRPAADGKVFLLSAESYDMPVVRVLNQEDYDRRVATVQNSSKTPKEKTQILGILASRCREASINEQGKLLVPKDLSDEAGIQAEASVWLVGRQSYFEVWNEENYTRVRQIEKAAAEDDLGIFD